VASGFDCAVWSTAREVAEVNGVTGVTPQSGVEHLAPVGRVRLEAGELPVTACFEDETDKPQRINENAVLHGTRRALPGVLDDQAEQRQSFLLLVDNLSRQDVELGLQASRTAVKVQHVREQHKIHRADRTTIVDAHIE
jgi:hypothetical protein